MVDGFELARLDQLIGHAKRLGFWDDVEHFTAERDRLIAEAGPVSRHTFAAITMLVIGLVALTAGAFAGAALVTGVGLPRHLAVMLCGGSIVILATGAVAFATRRR